MGIATQTTILAEASNLDGLVRGHSHPIRAWKLSLSTEDPP